MDYRLIRQLIAQWRSVAPCLLADYYPLTGYSSANHGWMAWQFDRPESDEGIIQAFRRADCPDHAVQIKLKGLTAKARYALSDLDTGATRSMGGAELMERGMEIMRTNKPGSAIVTYRKIEK